jgi:hypothetical protein
MRKLGDVLSLLPGNRPSCLGTAAIAAAGAATPPGASRAAALPDLDDEDDDEEERARRTLAEDGSVHLTLRKLAALEELQDLTEGIDNAKNLFIVGAFPALMQCVLGEEPAPFDLPSVLPPSDSSIDAAAGAGASAAAAGNVAVAARALAEFGPEQFAAPPVQARAAEVLATVLQNNPAAQGWALESGCMHALVTALARATLLADSLLLQQQQADSDAAESAPAAFSGVDAGLSLARRLEDQLALQTDLLTALSALSRDNGVAQAALVSGVQTQLPLPVTRAGAPASTDAAGAAGVSAAAEGGVAGTAGEGSFTVQVDAATLRQLAAACRADGLAAGALAGAATSTDAAGATAPVRVSPFQLIAHPLLFWAPFCGHPVAAAATPAAPSSSSTAAGGAGAVGATAPPPLLPASVRSRGRRLVRKCLFFLRHLMHGVHPDAIKAACLAVNPWILAPAAGSRLHALCTPGGSAEATPAGAAVAAASTGSGVFGLEGGGLAPLLLRVLHTLPVAELTAAPGAAAGAGWSGAAAAEGPEADDGDARDARENCLHVLLALTQKSEAGVSVVDDTEKRRVGPGGRPVPAPTRTMQLREEVGGSGVAGALPAHHASAAGSSAAPGGDSRAAARAAGTVASVPTAAATMIEARRAREAAAAVAVAGGSQPPQARQPADAVAAGSAAPAIAGLLAAPPANYEPAPAPPAAAAAAGSRATVTLALADGQPEAAAAAAAAALSHRPPQERQQLHGLNTPSLTLPQRMAALLRGGLGVPESLLAFSAETKRRAAAASGRAAAASAAVAASAAGSESGGASGSAATGATSASAAGATAAVAAEAAAAAADDAVEAWRQDAELYGAEAALAESVLRRLHTAASVMRALAGQGGSA